MKNRLVTLLALGAATSCLGMEEKDLKKSIIIKHNGLVKVSRSNYNGKNNVFFSVQKQQEKLEENDRDHSLHVYDLETNKIIKTSHNYAGLELLFLWSNRNYPQFFAVSKRNGEKNRCSLYDLQQNCKKIFSMEIGKGHPDSFGFAANGTTLFAYLNKTFKRYNILNRSYKEFSVNEGKIDTVSMSPDTQHLVVGIDKESVWEAVHYDIENDKNTPLVTSFGGYTFNNASTHISFFNSNDNTLNLYDVQKHEVIKQLKTEKPVITFLFPNDSMIIFTLDKTTFKLWDIENNKIIDLLKCDENHEMRGAILSRYSNADETSFSNKDLDESDSVSDVSVTNAAQLDSRDIIYFYNNKNSTIYVYDIARNKIFTIEIPGTSGLLYINNGRSYAAYGTHGNKVTFYSMDTWKPLSTLTFENAKQAYLNFSPCGNYAAIRHLRDDEKSDETYCEPGFVEIYDIKKDAVILKTPFIDILGSFFWFYSDSIIVVKSHATKLLLYNYKENKKAEIETKEEITDFIINNSFLAVSSGEQTELFKFEDIIFKNCETLESKKEIDEAENKGYRCIIA